MPDADDHEVYRMHNETFHIWFTEHVHTMRRSNGAKYSEEINRLADGPHRTARRYNAYIKNGIRFRIVVIDNRRSTQNSGVTLMADTMNYSSRKGKNPRVDTVSYYGLITDIIEVRYTNDFKQVLFKCDWIDNKVGQKKDVYGFTLVNFNHLLYTDNRLANEPFIFASQAEQIWYAPDPVETDWHVVMKMTQRNLFDMNSKEPHIESSNSQQLNEDIGWVRQGVEGTTVDSAIAIEEDEEMDDLYDN